MKANGKTLSIIPQPKSVSLDEAKTYHFKAEIDVISGSYPELVEVFKLNAKKLHSLDVFDGDGGIHIVTDPTLAHEEYRIECREDGIFLCGSDKLGVNYALATLHQMIENDGGGISCPAYTIKDKPDCHYRALFVEIPAFRTFDQVLHYVDLCHLYKVKYIDFHFAENCGYCLPSRRYPKIPTPGKSFSFEQVEILKKYCEDRGVEIIPEIEMPGHAKYLCGPYPELFCCTPIEGSARDDIICIGKEGMLDRMKALISEVLDMFPDCHYINIGGDEAQIQAWANCVDCVRYMKENNIPEIKSLYTHSVKLFTEAVLEMGKIPIVSEGFPKDGADQISRDVIVFAWESYYHLPNDLVEEGFRVINSSWMPTYIVSPSNEHFAKYIKNGRWYPRDIVEKWDIYTWKNWNKMSAAYEKPIVLEPTDLVIGGSLNVFFPNYDEDIQPTIENLAAISEKTWNINTKIAFEDFEESLNAIIPLAWKIKG